jgi:hypothetical protein
VARDDAAEQAAAGADLPTAQLEDLPTVCIPISSLELSDSPRLAGADNEHCLTLVESGVDLPPIVVHRESNRVIDGVHRIIAAMMRGEEVVRAKFFDGTPEDAFVLSVRMNIVHGLPLSRADRVSAVARIISSHPQWSNRVIASCTGLSASTVAKLRPQAVGKEGETITRIGKDGRVRPVDGLSGRLYVSELLERNPKASIREIARKAGVSPSTVHDVRKRLEAGEDPIPASQRAKLQAEGNQKPSDMALVHPLPNRPIDSAAMVAALMRDPSLRYSEIGRRLIRWLDGCRRGVSECPELIERVPEHSIYAVARLAREYSREWDEFAETLEQRRGAEAEERPQALLQQAAH